MARVTLHTGSIKKQKRTKLPLPLDGLRKGKETNPIEVNRKKEKTAARRRRGGIIWREWGAIWLMQDWASVEHQIWRLKLRNLQRLERFVSLSCAFLVSKIADTLLIDRIASNLVLVPKNRSCTRTICIEFDILLFMLGMFIWFNQQCYSCDKAWIWN